MPILMPNSAWRPLGPQSQAPLKVHDIICLHTMAGSLAGTDNYFKANGYGGTESHFGVGGDGTVYQWQDLKFQADANLDGNWHIISIETADMGPEFPKWNTSNPSEIPAWTAKQMHAIADVIAYCCKLFGIPCTLIPNSKRGNRGIGYHRQGVPGYVVPDGEIWSSSKGKVCPGERRISQIPTVIQLATQRLNPSAPLPTPTQAPSNPTRRTLYEGLVGDDVQALQAFFNRVFPSYPGTPIPLESKRFGPVTKSVVMEFQRRVGLKPVDGIVGPDTYSHLARFGFK